MSSLNRVTILGNLGADPEVRHTASGDAVVNLRLATSMRRTDKAGGAIEETEWHRVVLFRRNAETAKEYLAKGRWCLVEGRLQTRRWTDKKGIERYTTEIVGDRLVLLEARTSNEQSAEEAEAPMHTPVPPAGSSRERAMQVFAASDADVPF